jgi:hypothetical protein
MDQQRRDYLLSLFPEIEKINDTELAEKVLEIWSNVLDESPWERVEDVPKNPLYASESDTLLRHTQSVIRMAMAVAAVVSEVYERDVDMDILIAASVLHDVCKLREYDKNGLSEFGKLMQHGVYSAVKGFEFGMSLKMNHILLTHTKKSTVMPQTIEGLILHYVDYLDSDITRMFAGKTLLLGQK